MTDRVTTAIAVIFPGQGTQQPGMGRPWADHGAWTVVERAEKATGEPLGHLLLDADAEELSRTRSAQLSVFLCSLVAWEAARDLIESPVAFAGHSLGQITALVASGVLDLDDGLRLAARRAELTQAAADAHPGRMVALLGATPEQAEEACLAAPHGAWVANDNTVGQVAIAGTPEGVEAAATRAKELGVKRVMTLDVGGAFHTPLMQDAADGMAVELEGTMFHDPSAAVVHNTDAAPHTGAGGWPQRLVEHLVRPVRWRSTMETLVGMGVTTCIEVGHGTMLAGLAKRAIPSIPIVAVATPADVDALAAQLGGRTEHPEEP
jgi:[acyl-carrier-protein] S-malonyltransferase